MKNLRLIDNGTKIGVLTEILMPRQSLENPCKASEIRWTRGAIGFFSFFFISHDGRFYPGTRSSHHIYHSK